jgi:hypothetical protein
MRTNSIWQMHSIPQKNGLSENKSTQVKHGRQCMFWSFFYVIWSISAVFFL